MKLIDLTGRTFGRLTVENRVDNIGRKTAWSCRCECGNYSVVIGDNLRSGHTQSCGCLRDEKSAEAREKRKDKLRGETFGEWTVVAKADKPSYWFCRCSCGVEREVYAPSLKKGVSKSCGGSIHKPDFRDDVTGRQFGKLTVLGFEEKGKWRCLCECGKEVVVARGNLTSGNTKSCGCITSKGAYVLRTLLEENGLPFQIEYTPPDFPLKKYRFDFEVQGHLIEFDGDQHKGAFSGYYSYGRGISLLKRDFYKNYYCLINNIPLHRIPYERKDDLSLEDITSLKYLITDIDHYKVSEKYSELLPFLTFLEKGFIDNRTDISFFKDAERFLDNPVNESADAPDVEEAQEA